MKGSRNLAAPLLAAAALLLATPCRSQTRPPAAAHSAPAKKAKSREIPRVPVSELITRILAEEARLDTARTLSAFAVSPDERELARKAERLADHQLDLAFLVALRRAADNSGPRTPQISEIEATVKALESNLDDQQAVVDGLKKQAAKARGRRKQALQEQLEVEQAKLELAGDELADAREDLINAGGDLKSQIERLQAEHVATEHAAAAAAASSAAAANPAAGSSSTLLGNLKLWMGVHGLRAQLQAAQNDALAAVDTLRQRLEAFEKDAAGQTPPASSALEPPSAQPAAPAPSEASGSITLEMLRRLSRTQKILAGYKLRIRDMTELAATYGKWDALEAAKQKDETRILFFSALWIVLIVLVGIAANRLLQRLFARMTQERRRLHTLRTISRFGVQVFCLALILLVVLGPPSQLATLVAFAGAGLTVALKDFIVSFIGWFMLMGRNGVHAGDWVEINGVCGEVIEVTLFHTVLLETGNWNDPGHPTGRKVTFTNSYAIEGHYFNFTTSGQWLWDELEFLIPPGENPNAVAAAILQMVTAETQANAQLAEQEWSALAGTSKSAAAPSVSAAPVLNVRPTGSGITGRIRYITRANERFQARTRLYHLIVEALHGSVPPSVDSTTAAPPAPATRQA
jgi:small-conductance mechanosensitive channel